MHRRPGTEQYLRYFSLETLHNRSPEKVTRADLRLFRAAVSKAVNSLSWRSRIVAPVVVAGNGSQPVVIPPPEPTHWFTVAAVVPALTPLKLFVTRTLQRRVPPPPLIESLHWVTAVTGEERDVVWVVQAASGTPAAP